MSPGPVAGSRTPERGAAPAGEPILSVRDLRVRLGSEAGPVHAVRGIDLDVHAGRTLALVGESGAGKSVTALALMGLLPDRANVEGSVRLGGTQLLGLPDRAMSAYRGRDLAMIFQDPSSSLTPVLTVGDQIVEAVRAHQDVSRPAARRRAVELADLVGLPNPRTVLDAYPHELSGGMRQRVVIAAAIANEPRVLVADEPTTALDVTVQAQVLDVLRFAQHETGAGLLLLTHDLGIVAGLADDVAVLYAGRVVERAGVDETFAGPRMPYTLGLLGALPRLERAPGPPITGVDGSPPTLLAEPTGCPFLPRCPLAVPACADGEPALVPVPAGGGGGPSPTDRHGARVGWSGPGDSGHVAACRRAGDLGPGVDPRDVFPAPVPATPALRAIPREERPPVLEVRDLRASFPLGGRAPFRRRRGSVRVVDGVDLDLVAGECLALVGESGCGKTTTLRRIMDLACGMSTGTDVDASRGTSGGGANGESGDVRVLGTPVSGPPARRRARAVRASGRHVQLVFQDSSDALDPRLTVFEAVAEGARAAGTPAGDVAARVGELLGLVDLDPVHADRFPAQLSGGQRQRVGLARALAVAPSVLLLDEPVSALDVSVRAGVLDLLGALRAELGLAYVLVAHDLAVVAHVADRVAVMYLGRIVEIGAVEQVFARPRHPYTRALLSAVPIPDPPRERRRERIALAGDPPSPLDRPAGCVFASRCPVLPGLDAPEAHRCRTRQPPLVDADSRADHRHACFFPDAPLLDRSTPRDTAATSGPHLGTRPRPASDAPVAPGSPLERTPR
ncbi:ABC transporter ATP-binding protein [Agilicoccus flavus]|uniref:ABC transporter ATP-binding protein n=1 Tax=Agilicoccus flavus TaxID=2775968 RepID=UPI001CF62429|nr:dipeptide ABC transporter ATP-binding protein [Agilicoccus flavus]